MKNNIVRDIWDQKAFKKSIKIPYEELTLQQMRTAVGMERNCSNGATCYFIPIPASVRN